MINKPIISIDGVTREMNDEEFTQFELDVLEINKAKQEQLAKEEAKKSALDKLAALGLTEEEIAAL